MDEWILDDLLECSVCLERLDTSSKVLPCQHTFCKKCLEEIHRTHSELRCPECRILVETKIDDLPPNVLLMRILEGIRNAAPDQTGGVGVGGGGVGGRSPDSSKLNASGGGTSVDKPIHLNNAKTPPNENKLRKLTNQPYARAIYDYPAKEPGDLSFKKGDLLYLKTKIDNNWYGGVDANGKTGVFPVSYVQVIVPLPSQLPQCKALYDFKMTNDEEESCLAFVKGEIITVIRRVDENWAEGKLKDRIGIFPIAFVELNSVARVLMKLPAHEAYPGLSRIAPPAPACKVEDFVPSSVDQQPRGYTPNFSLATDTASDSSSTTVTSPSSTSSSTTPTPTTSSSLSPTSPPVIPVPSSSNKRHSFGSSLPHSALTKSKRHSAEIFISPDESEQPLSLPADIHAGNQPPPPQLERSSSQRCSKQATDVPPIPGPQAKHSSLQLPALYVALYPYKPQKGDEIELKRGALYSVTERCQDGWFKGTLLRTQKTGVFPGNYVAPAKSLPALQAQLRGRTKPFGVSGSPRNGTPAVEPRNPMSYVKPQPMPPPLKGQETNRAAPAPAEQQSTAVIPPPNVSVQALSSKATEKVKDMKEKRIGIMRRLASMKRSKSPPNTPYSMDNPVFEDSSVVFSPPVHVRSGSCPNQLLTSVAESNGTSSHWLLNPSSSHRSKVKERPSITPSIPPRCAAKTNIQHKKSSSMDTPGSLPDPTAHLLHPSPAHFRSTLGDEIKSSTSSSTPSIHFNDSTPSDPAFPPSNPRTDPGPSDALKPKLKLDSSSGIDFRLGGRSGAAPLMLAPSRLPSSKLPPSTRETSSSTQASKNHSQSKGAVPRERFRCIVPYPPNSGYELELQIGDVIYVHKKREDGWYRGTQERTGRTGLFPASFVQSF